MSNKDLKFSLIVATYGRERELKDLFNSLLNSDYKNFEIILVDQNVGGWLVDLVCEFSTKLNIKHIKSEKKGLSLNRNIGLLSATGDVVCFPDDDCTYYNDTLNVVNDFFNTTSFDFVLGRIYDRSLKCNVIKSWPKTERVLNYLNTYFYSSSITIFSRVKQIRFDERLGAGTYLGSCEDPDYILRHMKNDLHGRYTPKIEVNHPIPTLDSFNINKRISYARGFGFFLKKHIGLFIPYSAFFHLSNIKRLLGRELSFKNFLSVIGAFWRGFISK